MGENFASVAAALLIQVALGIVLARRLRIGPLGLARPLVVVALGALAVAIGEVLLIALDVALTPVSTTLAALVPTLAVWLGAPRVGAPTIGEPARHPTFERPALAWWLLAAAWVVLSLDASIVADSLPVVLGDDHGIWSAKAKVLYGASGSPASVADLLVGGRVPGAIACVGHPDYPWLNPLLQAHIHAFAGEIAHYTVRAPLQLFVCVAVLGVFEIVRRARAPLWFALPLAIALALAPVVRSLFDTAMSEGLMLAGVTALVVAQSCAPRDRRALSAIGLLMLVGAKNEGLALCVGWFLADAVVERDWSLRTWLRRFATAAPAGAAGLAHWLFNWRVGLQNDLVANESRWHGPLIAERFMRDVLFDATDTQLLVALLVLTVALAWRQIVSRRSARFALIFWLLGSAAYALALATTHQDPAWHWSTAGPRIWANLLPAVVAVVVCIAGRDAAPSEHDRQD